MPLNDGYCRCGCGEKTAISQQARRGYRKGEHVRFVPGHQRRVQVGTLEDRLAQRFEIADGDCWVWSAAKNHNGYGVTTREGRTQLAHRVVYEMFCEPIPEGLSLDHLCRVRACVNPDHLEPVTHAENMRRAAAVV